MKLNQIPIPTGLAKGPQTAQWVYDQITTFPESHDQGQWLNETACGTVACVAGWAVQPHLAELKAIPPVAMMMSRMTFFHDAGEDVLGISAEESSYLFDASRTSEEVLAALKELANGETMTIVESPRQSCDCDYCYDC